MDTNLVRGVESRTNKNYCLLVPRRPLKNLEFPDVDDFWSEATRQEANAGRQHDAPGRRLVGSCVSLSNCLLSGAGHRFHHCTSEHGVLHGIQHRNTGLIRHIAPEDIVVYSIAKYLWCLQIIEHLIHICHDLAKKISGCARHDRITRPGIGQTLFLWQSLCDIMAKHIPGRRKDFYCGAWDREFQKISYITARPSQLLESRQMLAKNLKQTTCSRLAMLPLLH